MKHLFIAIFALVAHLASAQFSVGGGLGLNTFMRSSNTSAPHLRMPSLYATFELPRSGDVTFFGRIDYSLPKANFDTLSTYVTAINQSTTPYALLVNYQARTNYFLFEGGNRYYLINDYDNGFSLYGGTGFVFGLGTVKNHFEKYDQSNTYQWEGSYTLDNSLIGKGTILMFGAFLQGGLKYTIPAVGTLFTDISGYYLLVGSGSNSIAASTQYYSPLFFNFSIGFKKDFY
jgi:hypothetical protein